MIWLLDALARLFPGKGPLWIERPRTVHNRPAPFLRHRLRAYLFRRYRRRHARMWRRWDGGYGRIA